MWPELHEMRMSAFEEERKRQEIDEDGHNADRKQGKKKDNCWREPREMTQEIACAEEVEALSRELGIEMVKEDGRHAQFVHTVDLVQRKTREQLDKLVRSKTELETKLGQLSCIAERLPAPELVKKELVHLTAERHRHIYIKSKYYI
jgi:hypothetical protein